MLNTSEITINKKRSILNTKNVKTKAVYIYNLIGFLLSMSSLNGNIYPFGLVFLTLERSFKKKTLITFLFVTLGAVCLKNKILAAKYIVSEVIYLGVLYVLNKDVCLKTKTASAVATISLMFASSISLYWQGITVYSVFELIIELMLTFIGVYVFSNLRNRIALLKEESKLKIKTETKIYFLIIAALLILSLKRFYVGNSISLINVASAYILMCIALVGTPQLTATYGVIIGMLCGIDTEYFLPITGALGLCGFLTGIFSKFGKGGIVAGLIVANTVITVYTNNSIEPMLTIAEILLATGVFVFLSDRFANKIQPFICFEETEKENLIKIKNNIKVKIEKLSKSLKTMAKNLDASSKKNNLINDEKLIDSVVEKVCKDCKKVHICWEKDFNKNCREFASMLDIIKSNGDINTEDISSLLKINCLHFEKIFSEISMQYNFLRLKQVFDSRVRENREIAKSQLVGISEVLDKVNFDFDNTTKFISADDLRRHLESNGLKPKFIDCQEDKNGKIHFSFIMKKKIFDKSGEENLLNYLKKICPRELGMFISDSDKKGYIRIKAYERELFMVEKGFASICADEKSGDNFGFYKLQCGKYVVILSDGMGKGEQAYKESMAVIELMDSFLAAGYDEKTAVKLINSLMMMKSENNSFATLDMCIIDLYSGKVEFIKTGAEASYIKNNTGLLTVSASMLPVGVSLSLEPEIFTYYLSDGDLIVMATDGIQTKEKGDSWLREFLEENETKVSTEEFSKRLLSKAEEINKGINDDMTVISLKLHKKAY